MNKEREKDVSSITAANNKKEREIELGQMVFI